MKVIAPVMPSKGRKPTKPIQPTQTPIRDKTITPSTLPVTEPDRTRMKDGGMTKKFKSCSNCPTPAKCKAAGKCIAKKAAAGMLVIPVKMEKAKKKVKK